MLIKKYIFTPILWGMGFLPINFLRCLGSLIGAVGIKFSKKAANRMRNNLLKTKIATQINIDQLAKQSARELGKGLIETMCIAWFRNKAYSYKLIKNWYGFDEVINASKTGKPIVFLTPHIGNFEIAIKAVAHYFSNNFTILYKPSKDIWFHHLMKTGRMEDNIHPVPTNSGGIIALVRALKRNEFIGVLPDSVASHGDGIWVDFFGNKVFATTLSAKMLNFKDAITFVVGSFRVYGGFNLEFIPYIKKTDEINVIVQDIYSIIEKIVEKAPTQYFWIYDRFRIPHHAR